MWLKKFFPLTRDKKILVAWYGSFDKNGTIGDLLSVQALTNFLSKKGLGFDCACYTKFNNIPVDPVKWEEVDETQYDILIFTCGPILKNHRWLPLLFEKFRHCIRIGIGVSLFPTDHFNYYDPFDYVFAREGRSSAFEDIAILSPQTAKPGNAENKSKLINIGISLRGKQSEYGDAICMHDKVDEYVSEACSFLRKEFPINVVNIENHLARSGKTPQEIEMQYSACKLILTTRFHGAMLAIRNSIPYIAIDQIKGGAKVHRLLYDKGWPHVYKIENVDIKALQQLTKNLLSTPRNKDLELHKDYLRINAKHSLQELYTCLSRLRNL